MNLLDSVFKIFILGRYIIVYKVGNLVLQRRVSGVIKHDFQLYISRSTLPNEKFEYG